ncbi:hypothetical protein BVRB_1g011410 [Beta vulgaris subsp. vulgaris]|nr:hypothetical protein BVRB_1g011410 [Beta vulgaris subsp. vulgaris]
MISKQSVTVREFVALTIEERQSDWARDGAHGGLDFLLSNL